MCVRYLILSLKINDFKNENAIVLILISNLYHFNVIISTILLSLTRVYRINF